jgi:nitrogen fixation protein FixH
MKCNPWPYAITAYFVIFIAAVTIWITFAVRNDQQLVRRDYYEQELKFQTDIDGQSRAASVNVYVDYDATKQTITLALPQVATAASVYFYRPSNAKLDREIKLALTNGAQAIDVAKFESGLWKLRVQWIADGAEFRHNATVVLAPTKISSL